MIAAATARALALGRRRGVSRGLLGRSDLWLLVGAMSWGLRGLRRALWPARPAVRTKLRMRPGERLAVTAGPPRRRR
ncbi:MAG: hypothetical protein OXH20_08790 [bacterium]|nr:hypothetical protein [bacterium]MXZ29346.1 hypothetical protein [Acidimicrobiia bacterium]MDE0669912.1 hypothetical protein [bacterium]MYB25279.1 hypothetical protein [Acidimicrobiia bacterium]MYE67338.1 hypothetical protein [Acidimicrobiia bacterium]